MDQDQAPAGASSMASLSTLPAPDVADLDGAGVAWREPAVRAFAASEVAKERQRCYDIVLCQPYQYTNPDDQDDGWGAVEVAMKVMAFDLTALIAGRQVPDPDWPHPGGRPCIDVAAPADAQPKAAEAGHAG